jgi:hypothetical protein
MDTDLLWGVKRPDACQSFELKTGFEGKKYWVNLSSCYSWADIHEGKDAICLFKKNMISVVSDKRVVAVWLKSPQQIWRTVREPIQEAPLIQCISWVRLGLFRRQIKCHNWEHYALNYGILSPGGTTRDAIIHKNASASLFKTDAKRSSCFQYQLLPPMTPPIPGEIRV